MKKLIIEELEKILNETNDFTDENLRFQNVINNVTYINYETFSSQYDSNIVDSNISITWRIGFKLNEFGVENFIINVEELQGGFIIELYDKQSDEFIQKTQKNINDFNWNFVIDQASLVKGGTLYISQLKFNFKNNTCTLVF